MKWKKKKKKKWQDVTSNLDWGTWKHEKSHNTKTSPYFSLDKDDHRNSNEWGKKQWFDKFFSNFLRSLNNQLLEWDFIFFENGNELS